MKKIMVLVLIFSMAVFGSCQKKDTPERLIMAIPDQTMMGLVLIAERLGYFEEENLIIEMFHPSSGRDAIISVLEGRADIGGSAEYPIAKEIYNGANLQVLTTIFRTNENLKLIAIRDHNIATVADLKGKRIACTFGTSGEYALSLILKENGLEDKEVEKVDTEPGDMTKVLLSGSVEAVVAWQPHVYNTLTAFPESELVIFKSMSFTEMSLLASTSEKIKEKEEAFLRLGRVLIRTEDYISLNSEEALKLLIDDLSDQSPDMLRSIWPDLY
nr:ABC transporter substrate-binding protein [Spirochaetaceae bacterium]